MANIVVGLLFALPLRFNLDPKNKVPLLNLAAGFLLIAFPLSMGVMLHANASNPLAFAAAAAIVLVWKYLPKLPPPPSIGGRKLY